MSRSDSFRILNILAYSLVTDSDWVPSTQTIVRIMCCSLWVKVHILPFIVFRNTLFSL